MATIKDVAKLAGVSVGTVSRYLNGAEIKDSNKLKVDEAVKVYNFKLNPIARTLKTNRTNTVGVVITNLSDIYTTTIIRSIEEELYSSGYNIIVCDSWGKHELELEKIDILLDKRVDGLILYPSREDIDYSSLLVDKKLPMVIIDRKVNNSRCDQVLTDNVNATYTATEWLINNNHRKIGIITGPKEIFTASERLKGYIRAHEDYNLELQSNYIYGGNFSEESGYEGVCHLMSQAEPPTAIISSNYYTTLGAVKAAYSLELKIPDELSLIGFDNIGVSSIARPSLSIIVQPMEELGKAAAQLLIKRINGDYSDFPNICRLKTNFVIKDSTRRL